MAIDKPAGWTSHDVVAYLRRVLKLKKIGHTGTLDPMATGVLVLCLGAFTRLSSYITAADKSYSAVLHLGIETDTFDADGQIVAQNPAVPQNIACIEPVVQSFIGKSQQIPPMFSAIKLGGKRLYEFARKGESVTRQARHIEIYNLDITAFNAPFLHLDVCCSKGTYIRSLTADIGQKLGCGAHLAALKRTAVGGIKLSACTSLEVIDALKDPDSLNALLLDIDLALNGLPRVELVENFADRFLQGNAIWGVQGLCDKLYRVVDQQGVMLGIGRWVEDCRLQPECVISRRES